MDKPETQSQNIVKGQMESNPRTTEEKGYRITPKGWIAHRTGLYMNVDSFWNDLAEFVTKQAKANGMNEGVPCLVLVDGGHCITAEFEAPKAEGAPSVPDVTDSSTTSY